MNINRALLLLVAGISWSAGLISQNFLSMFHASDNIISTGISANSNLNANADYIRSFESSGKLPERYGFIAHLNFPLFSQKKGVDFDFKIGAGSFISVNNHIKTVAGISWGISRTANITGTYVHSGFKFDFYPAYCPKGWMIAPHFSFNYQPLLHIKYGEYALRAFDDLYTSGEKERPANGWLLQKNMTFQTGVAFAIIREKWNVNFTAGFQHQPNSLKLIALPDIGIMPFYGVVNFGYALRDSIQK